MQTLRLLAGGLRRLATLALLVLAVNLATFLAMDALGGRARAAPPGGAPGSGHQAVERHTDEPLTFQGEFREFVPASRRVDAQLRRWTRPLVRYGDYLAGVTRGDLGEIPGSHGEPVSDLLRRAIPRSLVLLVLAVVVAAGVGLFSAYASLERRGARTNSRALILSLVGFSMPAFYVGILLNRLVVESNVWLGRQGQSPIIPTSGWGFDAHLILPVAALALRPAGEVARMASELMASELQKPYVRAAEAKGLAWRWVVWRHALPNVAATVLTTLGNSARYLVSSLIVVEVLFAWSGVGRALASAIAPRTDGRPGTDVLYDPAVVAGLMTSLAVLFVFINFGSGTLARAIDPRLRRAD